MCYFSLILVLYSRAYSLKKRSNIFRSVSLFVLAFFYSSDAYSTADSKFGSTKKGARDISPISINLFPYEAVLLPFQQSSLICLNQNKIEFYVWESCFFALSVFSSIVVQKLVLCLDNSNSNELHFFKQDITSLKHNV